MTTGNKGKSANLKPYKPGVSGNPRGRPKDDPEVKEYLRAHSLAAAQKLVELMSCGDLNVELKACSKLVDKFVGDLHDVMTTIEPREALVYLPDDKFDAVAEAAFGDDSAQH